MNVRILIYADPEDVRKYSLHAAVDRALDRARPDSTVGIYVGRPESTGLHETLLVFDADDNGCRKPGSFVVGQIERRPGAPLEYHS